MGRRAQAGLRTGRGSSILGWLVAGAAGMAAGLAVGRAPMVGQLAAQRRRTRDALRQARLLSDRVREDMETVREALVQLKIRLDEADHGHVPPSGPLYPPPSGHRVKEEAEALSLCAEVLAGRLERAGRDLALAG